MIWPINAAVFYYGAVAADFFTYHRQNRPSRNRARKTQAQSESLIARGCLDLLSLVHMMKKKSVLRDMRVKPGGCAVISIIPARTAESRHNYFATLLLRTDTVISVPGANF